MQRLSIALGVWLLPAVVPAAELALNFGECPLHQTPPGFRSTVSGQGQPGTWQVILDATPSLLPPMSPQAKPASQRSVLAQLARDKTGEHYPLLVYEKETFDDFKLVARFKLVSGEVERMAGIAFRIQDERNYYYVRASGLGDSFYFFKLVDGVRSPPIGAKVKIPSDVWHELTVECKGNQIRAQLNNQELIPTLNDRSFTRGKIAFWTKSDSVSYFADTRITFQPREIFAQRLVREVLREYPRLEGLKIFAAPTAGSPVVVIASNNPAEIGQPGGENERTTIAQGAVFHGKSSQSVRVTLPLHDHNGEAIAAVSVLMKGFPGQTEKNAIARAVPIVKLMQSRIRTADELTR